MGSIQDAVERKSIYDEGYRAAEKDALNLVAAILEVTGPIKLTYKAQAGADYRRVEWVENGADLTSVLRLREVNER